MQWRAASPYIIPLLVAAGFAVFVVLLLWRRRRVPGAYALVSLSLTAAIWSFGYAMEIGMVASAWAIVWARIQYIGIAFLPLAWLVFAYDYTDRRRLLSRRKLALLAIVPVLTQVLVWTNDLHGLIWRNIVLDATLPIPLLVYTHGPGFWMCNLVSHIYLLAGTLIL
ncbi:MAG TPA: histidine kinase N-terminal 7TM domain-containing protein, partial [Roseiflexaceae bacterium]|nr:histidine kinase N-terminal 7TM domain-containing protein [Roseiflexaceae bacterium]